jgi:hypothetical protein
VEVPPGLGEVLILVEERHEFHVVVAPSLVDDEGVRRQHGFHAPVRAVGTVADVGQVVEVCPDLPGVPGVQDRVDVAEVLAPRGVAVRASGRARASCPQAPI